MLKQLIPSTMAGVILGKGGDTINKLQTETATNIKMSKSGDFYPGTLDRVCLITGPAGNVRLVHNMIWERIRERYEKSGEDMKVKLVVPNATVGMIIGKGGCYVKQIKDETGAYVQISQKAQETMLAERVVTVAGTKDQIQLAFEMVFKMIVEDPQSGSCPNVSYADYKGPIANANPTGSPFANSATAGGDIGFAGASGGVVSGRNVNPQSVEMLKSTLRGNGYSIQASDEITAAMCTLSSYGLLGFGGAGLGSLGAMPSNVGGLSLDYLSTVLNGNRNPREMAPVGPGPMFGQFPSGPQTPDIKSVGGFDGGNFGNPRPTPNIGASDAPLAFNTGFPGFGASTNNNSFGLGTGPPMGSFQTSAPSAGANHDQSNATKELQVAENIVGAVIGPGGRAIVEIQKLTSATLQISKKGVFAPGTRNRIVTISGSSSAVERAVFMVQQCIQQEESKRSRQEQMLK